jgi:lipoprotein-releasing system ATP-binding protein
MDKAPALQAEHITKYFYDPVKFQVLNDIGFSIKKGEFVSITGKSGSGKSSLLYVLSTMDTDYEGTLFLDGEKVSGKKLDLLAMLRNNKLGFVFQFHYLLPEFTNLKNVMIPALRLKKFDYNEVEQRAYEKLKMLGVQELALKLASKISGGEQQRVAIARALINDPVIIMGDEPTGNLDSRNALNVFDIFKRLSKEFGQTIITVTHDNDFARKSDRILEMVDGKLVH